MTLMRFFSIFVFLLLYSVNIYTATEAQTDDDTIIVGFVTDNQTRTASVIDAGADGLTRLADIFQDYGATPRRIDLDNEVADDVDIIVLIGPERVIPNNQLAHLWLALESGAHLFAAFDPNGYQRVNTESDRTGVTNLLDRQYAIRLQDGMIVRPWYSQEAIDNLDNTWTEVQPEDIVLHPITEPLRQFNLPIYVWGSRHLTIDGFAGDADAIPLLYTELGYAELNRNALDTNSRVETPLELNIGSDSQGHLLVAGIAVDKDTGSRMVLLGDSELTQNIYGLTRRNTTTDLARFPGNDVFLYRLVGWILGLPEAQWRTLDSRFTQILIDGNLSEWSEDIPSYTDLAFDVAPLEHDIQQLRLVENDQFAFLNIETGAPITEDVQLGIRIASEDNVMSLIYEDGQFFIAGLALDSIEDAAIGVGEHIEVRIPRRLLGEDYTLLQTCVRVLSAANADCLDEAVVPTALDTIEPVPVRSTSEQPMGFIRSNGLVNLRSAPTTSSQVVGQIDNRDVFAVIGRNTEGDWYQIRNGRYEGWVASFLIGINADPALLAITDVDNTELAPESESTTEPESTGND